MATSTHGPDPKPVTQRIKEGIAKLHGCWIWQGSPLPNGYGRIGVRHGKNNTKGQLVHRVAYETFVGPIPKGLTIDHLCRNKLCVNPDHLEPVTQKINNFRAPNYVGNRTHCPAGHEYSPENTNTSCGRRRCLTCHRERETIRRLTLKGISI